MADDNQGDAGRTSRDLLSSQAGGGSGQFDGDQNQVQQSGQEGGGADAADMTNAGGSSGTGGYGSSDGQSRGERFDEDQGGGRGAEEVSPSADELEFAEDQRDHQERGQADAEFNADAG